MHHIKYEKNAKAKEMITVRVKGYMDRAEQIKKIIEESKKPKKKRASAHGKGGRRRQGERQTAGLLNEFDSSRKPNVMGRCCRFGGCEDVLKRGCYRQLAFRSSSLENGGRGRGFTVWTARDCKSY